MAQKHSFKLAQTSNACITPPVYLIKEYIKTRSFIEKKKVNSEPYLAIESVAKFGPDSQVVIVSPGHYKMRGAWMVLCCVYKARVGIQLDR